MLAELLCLGVFVTTINSEGVCPNSEIPCAGTCTERLSQVMDHGQSAAACKTQNKRTYMGSRVNDVLEGTCSQVVGEYETQYVWSRYKLRGGLVVDETGVTVDVINWGIKYCGGVDQLGNFLAHPCSWSKYAICISNMPQYDKDHMQTCSNEFYWVSDRSDLSYERAAAFCNQNNMELATPYTASRRSCFSVVLRHRAFSNAWIDYKITGATQSISPWDKEYCIKVNIVNKYMIDRCEAQLPALCATYGELEVSDAIVRTGEKASLTCRCFNCSVNDIKWTDGMTTWRVGERMGEVSVTAAPENQGVISTLTISTVSLDQAFTCIQTTPFSGSVIYEIATIDVYSLDVTSHYVFYGARITITCDFSNDKHLDINTVGWVDRRDNSDVSARSKLSYKGSSAISTLEIVSERYSHDILCTFHVSSEKGVVQYSAVSRVIVYKIEGLDVSVPSDSATTLTCDLKENEGRNVVLVPPTRVDWLQGGTHTLASQTGDPFRAVLSKNMGSGVDSFTCRFLFTNGDVLSKSITVTAFDFDGIPDVTANGTNAILTCKYSKGISPQEPIWWEREGVRINNEKQYQKETYKITSDFAKDAFYVETTKLTIVNAQYSAKFQCAVKVSEKVWRKDVSLTVYMNQFIAPNVTIVEQVDPNTGHIVVLCSVWANPRPNLQLFVDSVVEEGVFTSSHNMTSLEVRRDKSCDATLYQCQASNSEGTRETIIKSKLSKKCGFFAKLSFTTWLIIGGVVLFLLIIIIIICCCCCCCSRNKKKREVAYQREVLRQADGASSLYTLSRSESRVKGAGPNYEDMYSEAGTINYDPLVKSKYLDEVRYDEPLSETGPMSPQFLREVAPLSPKYHRIESDYEPSVAPLFSSRSRSRENISRGDGLFSPPLSRPGMSLSYQNLKDQPTSSPNTRHIQPSDDIPLKMNPFGNVQKFRNAENDEVASITSKIPPSEISDLFDDAMLPPVAILSPKGWEIPAEPVSLFSPPTGRRPKNPDRKHSDPAIAAPAPWLDAQDKVRNWNQALDEASHGRPPLWNTPPSTVGDSTLGLSSATLDTISITPKFMGGNPLPRPALHPEDRMGYCASSVAPSVYAPSTVGPSASQYQPSVTDIPTQRHNAPYEQFDIDDLSSVDVPDSGMDTLDRRIKHSARGINPQDRPVGLPATLGLSDSSTARATPSTARATSSTARAPITGASSSGSSSSGSTLSGKQAPAPPRGAVKVLPTLPRNQKSTLRTSNF